MAEKEVPGAEDEQARRDLLEGVAEEDESERLRKFEDESARAANAARQVDQAPAAAKLRLNATPRLKDIGRFGLIGKPVARLDTPAKCSGSVPRKG